MKYVLIFAAVVILVRIDVILSLFTRASDKISNIETTSTQEVSSERKLVSFNDDQSMKQTPRRAFLSLLEDFESNPSLDIRQRALTLLKENPKLFSETLDITLEGVIYRYRDLLTLKNSTTIEFLMELQKVLVGENQQMIRGFLTLLLDQDVEHFLRYYVKGQDLHCSFVTLLADNLPEQEKMNELYDRESLLKAFMAKESADPILKAYATNCQLVLRSHLDKIAPPPAAGPAPEENTEAPQETSP